MRLLHHRDARYRASLFPEGSYRMPALKKTDPKKSAPKKRPVKKTAAKKPAVKKPTAKKTVLFLHSAGPQGPGQGSSEFVRHLKKELGPGYSVLAPKLPRPQDPDYAPWKAKLAATLS